MRVSTAMTRNIYTVLPSSYAGEAFDLMKEAGIRHLPVIEDGEILVGIVSERDLLLHGNFEDGQVVFPEVVIEEIMTTEIISGTEQTTVAEAASIMIDKKIDCLPIIKSNGKLSGLVTSTDLLSLVAAWDGPQKHESVPFVFKLMNPKTERSDKNSRPWS